MDLQDTLDNSLSAHASSTPESKNYFLDAANAVETWPLMSSPWPVIAIVVAYLTFVIKIGPALMKDKKPYNIKFIILAYNLFQTIYNAYMVSTLFTTTGAVSYLWKHSCHPIDPAKNHYYYSLNNTAWLFFISKVTDLLDTIFFILRKKQSHVSFLHVYHHSNMVLFTWFYLKYIKGEQGAIVGWLNSLVHTIMYSYYFLSALGPQVQKYLWWKKYITRLQMGQFVVLIVLMGCLLMFDCHVPKLLSTLLLAQGVIFLILFTNFYIRSYIIRSKDTKSTAIGSINYHPVSALNKNN